MKKIVFIACFAITSLVFAQDISFGAKAGVNLANISYSGEGTENVDTKLLPAFHIGGMAEFELTDFIALQPEVMFSAQGTKFETEALGIKTETKLTYNYINIPIMGKFYVAEGLSLDVGPQIGLLLSAKSKTEVFGDISDDLKETLSGTSDIKENANGTDFGINVGLGYKLENGLNFNARYNFGFSNLIKEEALNTTAKNSVIQISLGYFFN